MPSPVSPRLATDPAVLAVAPGRGAAGGARDDRPLSRAAVVGVVGALAWAFAYFVLPWMTFTPAQSQRLREVLGPEIEALSLRDPETAERYRDLLDVLTTARALRGHDLSRYARAAAALNRNLQGDAPAGDADRAWAVQRGLPVIAAVLSSLPVAAAVALLLLLARSLRTPGTMALTLLLVAGAVGSALALAWERWADSLATDVLRGAGLSTALAASLAMACAGLFGVKAGTWWKVYGLAALLLGAGALAGWAHVMHGWPP